jgi:hypothetical protein
VPTEDGCSVGDYDREPGFLTFGEEFFQERLRRERDGKIASRLRSVPLGGSQLPVGPKLAGMPSKGDEM